MASDLMLDIKADPRYKKYVRILETVSKRIDVDRDLKEAMALHASRTSRELYGDKQFSPKAIYLADAKDMSNRARLVEIRERNSVQISMLSEATKKLHRYIRTHYMDEMREYKNEANRKAVLERVTAKSMDLIAEVEALMSTIDIFVKDIDQAGHSIRRMVDVLKLLAEKPGKVL